MHVRPAVRRDRRRIEALLAPHVEAGAVLPRAVRAADFLVAEEAGALHGAVALTPWTAEVAELGSLVAEAPGRGVGRALVDATLALAGQRGHRAVVALTGLPGFFERLGFAASPQAPWGIARGLDRVRLLDQGLDQALDHKAERCATCPRLPACAQTLLVRELAHKKRRACA
ncbi:MAG: hypothetical protein H6739_20080 [Alphaproteobacteria bacterium]|nr:hypothetical protein [Alphaproteobacteria bacterium]